MELNWYAIESNITVWNGYYTIFFDGAIDLQREWFLSF